MQTAKKLSAGEVATEEPLCPEIEYCPICKHADFADDFANKQIQVQYCKACQLKFLNPQPSDQTLQSIYNANYFLNSDSAEAKLKVSEIKRATARIYLELIEHYAGNLRGKLLEIGSGTGDFLVEAQAQGFEVTGIEYSEHAVNTARARLQTGTGRVISGEVDKLDLPADSFDVCVLSDVIEHARNPEKLLTAVHRLLKPNGILFLAVPSWDSWSAKLMGQHWIEFKPEHLFYFNRTSLENLLFVTNFNRLLVRPNHKVLTPKYIFAHFDRFEVPVLTSITRLADKLLPKTLSDRHHKLVASGSVVLARKQEARPRRKLSVIMPVFNECGTFQQAIEQLLHKEIEDLDIEIIIVESNSTDGTRQMALKYEEHPRIKLVLEETAQGKGHAVRTGLLHATGDFILIQDADLEYDIDDYEDLLEPLRSGKAAFVLGTRHDSSGALKMRHFVDQPVMAALLNFGHVFFSTLLNVLYRQRLNDPFTMYKVFRRDCLMGLKFECNRFDFDYELVIKLIRKGYTPVEIPVTYQSRSFNEGKKVTVFRDPLTWIVALARFRVQRLNLAQNVREANLADLEAGFDEAKID
jgi:2-polyprenyl-3-methyl-5-hydroxy-6-metoxy-1,4-benzoquinol methylase